MKLHSYGVAFHSLAVMFSGYHVVSLYLRQNYYA